MRRSRYLVLVLLIISMMTAISLSFATDDPDKLIREQNWDALENAGSEAIPKLIPLLKHELSLDRAKAAELLGKLNAKEAIEPLIDVLNDKSKLVVIKALESLAAISGEDFGTNQVQWTEWHDDFEEEDSDSPPPVSGVRKIIEYKPEYDEYGNKID